MESEYQQFKHWQRSDFWENYVKHRTLHFFLDDNLVKEMTKFQTQGFLHIISIKDYQKSTSNCKIVAFELTVKAETLLEFDYKL